MPIYHLSAKVLGRSAGRSATGAAAYRAGERIEDLRTGQVFDYTRRRAIEHREIIAPAYAPAWMLDRSALWNAVERGERRRDAQVCREVEVALPRELSPSARLDLVRDFARDQFVSRGMVADVAIHIPKARDGAIQPHAHILLTMRELTASAFGQKVREWNRGDLLDEWRGRWADHANRALERAGMAERIDHRSLADQRDDALRVAADPQRPEPERAAAERLAEALDRTPTMHLGPTAAAMERRGAETDRGVQWRRIQAANIERARLRRALEVVRDEMRALAGRAADIVRQGVDVARDRMDALLGRRPAAAPAGPVDRDALLGRRPAAERVFPGRDRDDGRGR